MIKKITAYQTSDGSIFALESDAQKHESLLSANLHKTYYTLQAGDLVESKPLTILDSSPWNNYFK